MERSRLSEEVTSSDLKYKSPLYRNQKHSTLNTAGGQCEAGLEGTPPAGKSEPGPEARSERL